jgi:hypothetical protein
MSSVSLVKWQHVDWGYGPSGRASVCPVDSTLSSNPSTTKNNKTGQYSAYAFNPSYLGGRDKEDCGWRPVGQKVGEIPSYLIRLAVVAHLLS